MNYPTPEKPIGDITIFICDTCGEPTVPSYIDDVKTQWYKCEKGHTTSTPMKKNYTAEGRDLNLPVEDKKLAASYGFGSRYATDDTDRFNPNSFANMLTGQFFFKTDKKTDLLYIWNSENGTYDPDGEIFIHQALVNRLGLEVKPHYQLDAEYFIKGLTYTNIEETTNLLAFKNCVLNVETLTTLDKSPAYFIISKLPVTYDPKTQLGPVTQKFLIDVFGENQLIALQEALGYTLLKTPLFEKAFMLIGDGANGKSTFLNLLQALLGRENYSNVTLQEICYNRFAAASLYQKMANISSDLPKTAIATSGRFKMLTGKDTVSAEFKHKNAFQFLNTAKMWFSCNEFPQTTEDTLAYVRRWKIFNCPNVFLGANADPKILEKLTTETELSGFLNWCLDGLKRLLTNGRFSANETEETLRENILKLSNPTQAFLEKNIEASNNPKDYIIETELYASFIAFCDADNLPTVRKSQFTAALKEYFPNIKQTKQRVLGKPTEVYQFIRKSVPSVRTTLLDAQQNQNSIKISSEGGTERTEGTKRPKEASNSVFYVKDIPAGEKCDCGKYPVTKEILIPSGDTIRRCEQCFSDLKATFTNALFKPSYPDLEMKEGEDS
jgi:putative DNA primase/helicase